jgi:hypothetical protein
MDGDGPHAGSPTPIAKRAQT